MHEKRRYKRFGPAEIGINCKLMLADKVEIIDISVGGVALKAARRLNIGSEYLLTLICNGRDVKVKGTVVRSALSSIEEREDGERVPVYTAGLIFRDDTAEKISEVLQLPVCESV